MRDPLQTMVAALLRSLRTSADDQTAAEPAWTRLAARARSLGVDAQCTPAALNAAIAAAPHEPLTPTPLELAVMRTSALPPPQALRVSLLLHAPRFW